MKIGSAIATVNTRGSLVSAGRDGVVNGLPLAVVHDWMIKRSPSQPLRSLRRPASRESHRRWDKEVFLIG